MTIDELHNRIAAQTPGAASQHKRDLITARSHMYNASVTHARMHMHLTLAFESLRHMENGAADIADQLQKSEALAKRIADQLQLIDAKASAADGA